MLLITCPYCGARNETEFRCGGQSHVARPSPTTMASDADWGAYLFGRQNPRGVHFERWVHAAGCRQWFNVARDTRTHEILAVYEMGAPKPEVG